VLTLVAVLYAVGLAWLHRLGVIPTPGRFLAGPAIQPEESGPFLDPGQPPPPRQVSSGYISAGYGDVGYPLGGDP
jgi:hypothetical protein